MYLYLFDFWICSFPMRPLGGSRETFYFKDKIFIFCPHLSIIVVVSLLIAAICDRIFLWAASNILPIFSEKRKNTQPRGAAPEGSDVGSGCLTEEGRWREDGVDSDQLKELLWHHVPLTSYAMHLFLPSMHLSGPAGESVNFWNHGWGERERLLEQVADGRAHLQRTGGHRRDCRRKSHFEVPHLRRLFGSLRCGACGKSAGAFLHQG